MEILRATFNKLDDVVSLLGLSRVDRPREEKVTSYAMQLQAIAAVLGDHVGLLNAPPEDDDVDSDDGVE